MSAQDYYGSQSHSSQSEYRQEQHRQGNQQSYSSYSSESYAAYPPQPSYESPPPIPHGSRPVNEQHGYDRYNAPPRGHDYAHRPESASPAPYGQQQYPHQAGNNVPGGRYSPQPPTQYPPYPQTQLEHQPQYGQPQHGYQPPTQPQNAEDRGVMGALAGGAAGAYGGHQLNHGVIGAVGGAFAGSKLQDHFSHDDEKKKKEEGGHFWNRHDNSNNPNAHDGKHNQHAAVPPPVQQHHYQEPPHALAGNFSASANNITLDGDYDLIASCRDANGHQKTSSISLNSVLTNTDGHLGWARGGNFGASAKRARLIDNGRVLEAELGDGRGGWNISSIRLDEKITNDNGELKFVG